MKVTIRRTRIAAILMGAAIVAMTGPATARPPMPTEPAPAEGQAVIYIYKLSTITFSADLFYVDNIKVAVLGIEGCTRLIVPAGDHIIGHGTPIALGLGSLPDRSRPVSWEAGRTYYYTWEEESAPLGFRYRFVHAADGAGPALMQGCRYTPPVNQERLFQPHRIPPPTPIRL